MKEEWLIDGYNLLYDLQSRQKHAGVSRNSLCELLAEFASSKQSKVILVFDGVGPNEEWSSYRTEWFEVFYSQKISADAFIERSLFERRGQANLMVVTNDHAITNIAVGGGAHALKGSVFLESLRTAEKTRKEVLDRQRVETHGFNRPFDEKLKKKGLI